MRVPRYLHKPLIITLVILIVGALLFSLSIMPARTRLIGLQTEIALQSDKLNSMQKRIAATAQQRALTEKAAADFNGLANSGILEPLLGSYAMRGKLMLDPLARESGFAIANVRELCFIPLPVPKTVPKQLYGRQLVEFAGTGGYTQIVAFVTLAEERFPLVTLAGLRIESRPQTPEEHRAVITFEWPATWEASKP